MTPAPIPTIKGARVTALRVVIIDDETPDVSWLDGARCDNATDRAADAARLAAFNRGDWRMTGVRIEAAVIVNGTIQSVSTPGLWGVESDASAEYIKDVAADEYVTLKEILATLGIKKIPARATAA